MRKPFVSRRCICTTGALLLVNFFMSCQPVLDASASSSSAPYPIGIFPLFFTGWENADSQTFPNRDEYYLDVIHRYSERRTGEKQWNGNYALRVSGTATTLTNGKSYCYKRLFDTSLYIGLYTKISFWVYHESGTSRVSIDGHFSDGSTIRDYYNNGYITDQYGVRVHPAYRNDPVNGTPLGVWRYIDIDLSRAAGKWLDYIMVGYDDYDGAPFYGPYVTYIDDLRILSEIPWFQRPTDTPRVSPQSPHDYSLSAIDFANSHGVAGYDPVFASAPGQVVAVIPATTNSDNPFGNAIIIHYTQDFPTHFSDDNDVYVAYAHFDKILVGVNSPVKAGTVIGIMGNTGVSSGPHVHVENVLLPYQQYQGITPSSNITTYQQLINSGWFNAAAAGAVITADELYKVTGW